jgi:hypothetical protein
MNAVTAADKFQSALLLYQFSALKRLTPAVCTYSGARFQSGVKGYPISAVDSNVTARVAGYQTNYLRSTFVKLVLDM